MLLSTSVIQDTGFIKQLLEYLDQTTDPGAFSPGILPEVPVLGEPAGKGRVSVENVQSKTTQTQLDVPKKKKELAPDPFVRLDQLGDAAEVEQWIQGPGPDLGLLLEPQKKDMGSQRVTETEAQRKRVQVEEELTVGVSAHPSPVKDADFGFVITEE